MPIKQTMLLEKARNFQKNIFDSKIILETSALKKSAFLCHSHADEEMVKGLLMTFQEAGVDLYVDWKDHTMPDKPNVDTAQKIQSKIVDCDLFIFLATARSKSSRWCPWEIGFADAKKKRIYILPTADGNDVYGNEYLELYSCIDQGTILGRLGLGVFEAGVAKGKLISTSIL